MIHVWEWIQIRIFPVQFFCSCISASPFCCHPLFAGFYHLLGVKKSWLQKWVKKMIHYQLFSYKPLYICLKWCTKKASADYDQCLICYPLFGSLFLLAIFFFFSFLANSCSGIDEDFSFRLSTNRNLCNSCRSKFFRSQQISEFVYSWMWKQQNGGGSSCIAVFHGIRLLQPLRNCYNSLRRKWRTFRLHRLYSNSCKHACFSRRCSSYNSPQWILYHEVISWWVGNYYQPFCKSLQIRRSEKPPVSHRNDTFRNQ